MSPSHPSPSPSHPLLNSSHSSRPQNLTTAPPISQSFLTLNLHIIFPIASLLFTILLLYQNKLYALYRRQKANRSSNAENSASGHSSGGKRNRRKKGRGKRRLSGRVYERLESEADTGVEGDDEGEALQGNQQLGIELDVLSGGRNRGFAQDGKRWKSRSRERTGKGSSSAVSGVRTIPEEEEFLSEIDIGSEASDTGTALLATPTHTPRSARQRRSRSKGKGKGKSKSKERDGSTPRSKPKLRIEPRATSLSLFEHPHPESRNLNTSFSSNRDYDASASSPGPGDSNPEASFSSSWSASSPSSPTVPGAFPSTHKKDKADASENLRRNLAAAFIRHPHGVTRADLSKSGTFKPYPRLRRRRGVERLRSDGDNGNNNEETGEVSSHLLPRDGRAGESESNSGNGSTSTSETGDDESSESDGELGSAVATWFEELLRPAVDRFVRFIGNSTREGVERKWQPGAWRKARGRAAAVRGEGDGRTIEEILKMDDDGNGNVRNEESGSDTQDAVKGTLPDSPTREMERLMYGSNAATRLSGGEKVKWSACRRNEH